jgi:glycosyltransferase involved in cell wall biosynthesis
VKTFDMQDGSFLKAATGYCNCMRIGRVVTSEWLARINGKRIAVVLPAYNAEKTLAMSVRELSDIVDIKILVDDSSKDETARPFKQLGLITFVHGANYGYGRNQQTCYREALGKASWAAFNWRFSDVAKWIKDN